MAAPSAKSLFQSASIRRQQNGGSGLFHEEMTATGAELAEQQQSGALKQQQQFLSFGALLDSQQQNTTQSDATYGLGARSITQLNLQGVVGSQQDDQTKDSSSHQKGQEQTIPPMVALPNSPYLGILSSIDIEIDSTELCETELRNAYEGLSRSRGVARNKIIENCSYYDFGETLPLACGVQEPAPSAVSWTEGQYSSYIDALCDLQLGLTRQWRRSWSNLPLRTNSAISVVTGTKRGRGNDRGLNDIPPVRSDSASVVGNSAMSNWSGYQLYCREHPLYKSFSAMFFLEQRQSTDEGDHGGGVVKTGATLCALVFSNSAKLRTYITKSLIELVTGDILAEASGSELANSTTTRENETKTKRLNDTEHRKLLLLRELEDRFSWVNGGLFIEEEDPATQKCSLRNNHSLLQHVSSEQQTAATTGVRISDLSGVNLVQAVFDVLLNLPMCKSGMGSLSIEGDDEVEDLNRQALTHGTKGIRGPRKIEKKESKSAAAVSFVPMSLVSSFSFVNGTKRVPQLQRLMEQHLPLPRQGGGEVSIRTRYRWRLGGGGSNGLLLPHTLPVLICVLEEHLGLGFYSLLPKAPAQLDNIASSINAVDKSSNGRGSREIDAAASVFLLSGQANEQEQVRKQQQDASIRTLFGDGTGLINAATCCSRLTSSSAWFVDASSAIAGTSPDNIVGLGDPHASSDSCSSATDTSDDHRNEGGIDWDQELGGNGPRAAEEDDLSLRAVAQDCEFTPLLIRRCRGVVSQTVRTDGGQNGEYIIAYRVLKLFYENDPRYGDARNDDDLFNVVQQ